MANNYNQVFPVVSSNAYNPNSLSIFPDLLQPAANPVATREQHELPAFVELAPGEDARHIQARVVSVLEHRIIYSELQNELLRLHHAGLDLMPATPTPTLNIHHTERFPARRPRTSRTRAPARPRAPLMPIPAVPREPSPEPDARVNHVDCPICMTPFFQPTTTRCGHVFCWRCVTHAMVDIKRCPICRTRITRRDLFRIYLS